MPDPNTTPTPTNPRHNHALLDNTASTHTRPSPTTPPTTPTPTALPLTALPPTTPPSHNTLAYNALTLDRVPHLRADPTWVHTQLARPDARVIPFHQDRIVDTPTTPDEPTPVFLGLDGDTPVFAT